MSFFMPSTSLSSGIPERSLIACTSTLPIISLPSGVLSILNLGSSSGKRLLRVGYCLRRSFKRVCGVISVTGVVSSDSTSDSTLSVFDGGVSADCSVVAGASLLLQVSRVCEPYIALMWVQSCIISSTPRNFPFLSRTGTYII